MAAQDPNAPTDSNGGALVATAAVMLAFSWLSVCLRSFVRAKLTNGFQWDDWLMLVAQANFTTSCSLILMGVRDGLGRHNKALDQYHEIQALKYQALATATYVLNMWLIKLSIGIFLLRLATQKRYRYTLYGSLIVVSIWSVVLFFWNIFQCNPVSAQWDYTILEKDPKAHCVSADEIVNAAYALSVMNILSDWLYALIPIPMLWSVKMTTQAKMTVVVVLGLGIFASVATLVRIKFLSDLTEMEDLLHAATDAMVWTLIEPGVAIVASSLVTIRPVLRKWRIKGFGSSGLSRPTNAGNNSHPASRVNRSTKMPAFGFNDFTLVDIEAAHAKNSKPCSPVAASFGGKIQRSLSLSDAGSMTSKSYLSRASSDATIYSGKIQRSRSISDADTLAGRSHRSRPSYMSRVHEAPIEEDDGRREYFENESKRIKIKSEMYIIEGNTTPTTPTTPTPLVGTYQRDETWLAEQDSSNDGSLDLTHVQSQDNDIQNSLQLTKPLPTLPSYRR
ncbi:hypothetical protein F4811DRAFT_481521 [Daldinia bambusicola]|nr:hypothetical protein F4811DRAFT_481521 [Daldinia bambusicola]